MAIDKRGQGFELGMNENKSRRWPERDFNQGRLTDCESSVLATQPRCPLTKRLKKCFLVRYGDRAPISFMGRILAIVVILTGLVLFSLVNGILATSITSVALETDYRIYGAKVRQTLTIYGYVTLKKTYNSCSITIAFNL